MIITQTPLRLSLLGGGTDFPDFYRANGGAVLTAAIDKYVYVIVKERFDTDVYLNYSIKEIVTQAEDLQHDLAREAMRMADVTQGVEITTLADVPSSGSGLGSSSSVTVGLLNALYAHQGRQRSAEQLAADACKIEIDILGKPIGVQDQLIAAHGNLCFIEMCPNGEFRVERFDLSSEDKRRLLDNVLLFFTNRTRRADTILGEQKENIARRNAELNELRDLAFAGRDALRRRDFDGIGALLHDSWLLKQRLASGISDGEVDAMYSAARRAGAIGGKVAGAGGGGFLMLYCPLDKQVAVRQALREYRELPVHLSRDGSRVIFNINT